MTQHAELILILEKRLAKGSQIQQDYLKAKAADNTPSHTWYSTMLRIGQVLAEARAMMNLIKSYGNPETVYSLPASAVPPDVGKKETSRASAKAPSPTPSASSRSVTATVRTSSSYVPTQHGLSVRVPRKYRSYRCFVRAGRAELRRTRWHTAPSCITPTPTRITKLSGRVLQWGWLGLRWGILNGNSTSSFLDTRNEFSFTPEVLDLT